MRIRLLGLAAALLAIVVGTMPVSADSGQFNPPKRYYLSLGDSVAFGFQRDKVASELAAHSYSPADFPGFTSAFGDRMRAVDPQLTVVDYACPGESTKRVGCIYPAGWAVVLDLGSAVGSRSRARSLCVRGRPGSPTAYRSTRGWGPSALNSPMFFVDSSGRRSDRSKPKRVFARLPPSVNKLETPGSDMSPLTITVWSVVPLIGPTPLRLTNQSRMLGLSS